MSWAGSSTVAFLKRFHNQAFLHSTPTSQKTHQTTNHKIIQRFNPALNTQRSSLIAHRSSANNQQPTINNQQSTTSTQYHYTKPSFPSGERAHLLRAPSKSFKHNSSSNWQDTDQPAGQNIIADTRPM
jgi:hypothetical protein